MISQYTKEPQYTGDMRYFDWARYLVEKGHEVYILCSSVVHNSEVNLLTQEEEYKIVENSGIKYVYVYSPQYTGNGVSRVKNMLHFYRMTGRVLKKLPPNDLIIARSPSPLACVAGIRYAKKHKIPCFSDIVDLWPESIKVYGFLSKRSLFLKVLYLGEKWIYKNSTGIFFSMPGCYDYICERGWQKVIPQSKVHYINIGVNVAQFDRNASKVEYPDPVLTDDSVFKIAYTGSVRTANGLQVLCDAGLTLKNRGLDKIFILIYGAGDQVDELRQYCADNGIDNVRLYGRIEKNEIPFILTHSDICFLCYRNTPLLHYGGSMNKMFEYFASGKPVLTNAHMNYSFIEEYECGVEINSDDPERIADEIEHFYSMSEGERAVYGRRARKAAEDYDINRLCEKMYSVVGGILKETK